MLSPEAQGMLGLRQGEYIWPTWPRRLQLHDGRALLTAIALMITSVIFAQMVAQYVTTTEVNQGLIRSRLWWEMVLNLQLLSVGMIWFSYSDRISIATGPIRRMHIINCGFVSLSVFMPTFLGVVSASNNWFEIRPGPDVFVGFFLFGISAGLIGLVLQTILYRLRRKSAEHYARRRGIWFFLPSIALGLAVVFDAPGGGTWWLILTPILLYLQGAVPYLLKAFRPPPAKT